jgi:hypothetical protein
MPDEDNSLEEQLRRYSAYRRDEAVDQARKAVREEFEQNLARGKGSPRHGFVFFLVHTLKGRIAIAASLVLVATLVVVPNLVPKRVEVAMFLPPLKSGTPTEAGTLVEVSVAVSVNWKKQTIQIPLKAGGELTGQIKSATNAAPLPLAFDVAVAGTNAGQPVNGTGQLLIMPQNPSDKLERFSTNALLWVKLDLKLRTGGKEEPLYRVFGTP